MRLLPPLHLTPTPPRGRVVILIPTASLLEGMSWQLVESTLWAFVFQSYAPTAENFGGVRSLSKLRGSVEWWLDRLGEGS